ncbi:MAG: hypothetical protein ACI9P5_003000 [Saprospiraceae bacterium]|jgi:hypothetical protein
MAENQVVDVVVIKSMNMKYILILLITVFPIQNIFGQEKDSTNTYKKRVLDTAEADFLFSYYEQDGQHSAVNGGIGTEKLSDITPTFILTLPLNSDDVLTIDIGISAYSSASSSNINPFNSTGASVNNYDDDDDDDDGNQAPTGSPWVASSGASKSDALKSINLSYSHSSNNRNNVLSFNAGVSKEYDYGSIGFGAGYTKLFNQKNTELNIKGQVYLDTWNAIYPTELHEYESNGNNFLNRGFFNGVIILNQNGTATRNYLPSNFDSFTNNKRNSFALSLGFSQILSRNLQVSFFLDIIKQQGLLSTPYQRVYFEDKENYFIGNVSHINNYTSSENTGVYQLADDVERLPASRLKIPIGARLNYYLNESLSIRSYYRYYQDNWGLKAHTMNMELPFKLGSKFTIYPNYRYYKQRKADYFAPFETHISTEQYYTSDYDLSSFKSNSIGFGISYKDIMTSFKIGSLGLKNIDLRYQNYQRSDGLNAGIISLAMKFTMN